MMQRLLILAASIAGIGFVAVAADLSPAFSEDIQESPPTDCDTYAASNLDPERKGDGLPFEKTQAHARIQAVTISSMTLGSEPDNWVATLAR
jgi:hypothetical protein